MPVPIVEPPLKDVTPPLTGRRRVLVRLAGELGTKSPRTRRRFLATLVANATRALRTSEVPGVVRHDWSRVGGDAPDPAAARRAVAHLFGVHSAVEVREVSFDSLAGLVDALE